MCSAILEGLGGLVSASYGASDVGHMEDGEDKGSGDEDSGDSSRNSVSPHFSCEQQL